MSLHEILRVIKKHCSFLISTHIHPDPDAVCSELALADYLRSLGKNVVIVHEEKLPARLKFLPGAERIKAYQEQSRDTQYDAAIIVDCGDLGRIGKVQELIGKGRMCVINIDHHITNDYFGDITLVESRASSTAEVIYGLLRAAKYPLNETAALYLYAGIMTDTGSFRYENTSARTHAIIADLLKFNLPVNALYGRFYETMTPQDARLLPRVLNTARIFWQGRVAAVNLSEKIMKRFSDEVDVRDMIFKFLRTIEGVEAFVIFTEVSGGRTRVNFRSNHWVNVAELAQRFQGGGHARASGCVLTGDIAAVRGRVLRELKKVFQQENFLRKG